MEHELLVAATVNRWAHDAFPAVRFVADTAVAAALAAFAGGASVSEACCEGRRYIECCQRHPSTAVARLEARPLHVA